MLRTNILIFSRKKFGSKKTLRQRKTLTLKLNKYSTYHENHKVMVQIKVLITHLVHGIPVLSAECKCTVLFVNISPVYKFFYYIYLYSGNRMHVFGLTSNLAKVIIGCLAWWSMRKVQERLMRNDDI